jgi:hypothetical protein
VPALGAADTFVLGREPDSRPEICLAREADDDPTSAASGLPPLRAVSSPERRAENGAAAALRSHLLTWRDVQPVIWVKAALLTPARASRRRPRCAGARASRFRREGSSILRASER